MMTAWVIEVGFEHGSPRYYCPDGTFCDNPNHARKFATQVEAQAHAVCMRCIWRVAEHAWYSPPIVAT